MNILILGGSGFIGRALCARLAAGDHRLTVLSRQRDRAREVMLLPTVTVLEGSAHDSATLRALLPGHDAVINLVGILNERRRGDFERTHVELVRQLIDACHASGVRRLLHLSALGASEDGPSAYQQSKGRAETLIRQSGLDYTLFAPSVVFGQGDSFLNRFAHLAGLMPPLVPFALPGASARFQPVWVNDVARVIEQALVGRAREHSIGQRYELVGPRVYTLRQLVRYTLDRNGDRRPVWGLPGPLATLLASVLQCLPSQPLSRDNLKSMRRDNISDQPFPSFAGSPTALEDIAPHYLGTTGLTDAFSEARKTPSLTP